MIVDVCMYITQVDSALVDHPNQQQRMNLLLFLSAMKQIQKIW